MRTGRGRGWRVGAVCAGWLLASAGTACGGSPEGGSGASAGESKPAVAVGGVPAPEPAPAKAAEAKPSPAQTAPAGKEPAPVAARPERSEPVAVAKPAQEPAPSAPKPPQIPLGELLGQRDLWPPKVALTKPLTIARGVTLPVGHELAVYEFNGSDIALDTGEDIFECPASQTDVIERASALKASLTPEQLALNDNTLGARQELWPVTVTVTRRLQFQNGRQIPVGREVTLRSVTNGWVSLYDDELADHFQAEVFETDVIARARERLRLPEAEREPFFRRAIAAALEPKAGAEARLAQADYLLVYRARLGCTRCAAFAPELASFYERVKGEHPGFEAVFYSDDKTAEDAREVFAKEALPGRAIRFDRRLAAADLASQSGQLLPLVYLYDKAGNLLAQNSPSGGRPSAEDILSVLEAKLGEAR